MTWEHPSCSLQFYIIVYKYEPLPLQINHLFTHPPSLSNWELLWIYMFQFTSLKRYIDSLYIFYNLYIKPDHFTHSQLRTQARSFCTVSNKFFECRRLVDTPVMNISIYSQLSLNSECHWPLCHLEYIQGKTFHIPLNLHILTRLIHLSKTKINFSWDWITYYISNISSSLTNW
jgi:hypothetical protein